MKSRRAALWALAAPGAVLLAAALWWSAPGPMPDYQTVKAHWRPSHVALRDRNGVILSVRRTDFAVRRGRWAALADISPSLPAALIAAEDRRFYRHHGIDWRAVAGAAWNNVHGQPRRGASTITMQLATLLQAQHAPKRRTWRAKIRQARMALVLERRWSKAQILESYLNLLNFRGEVEGISAAANVLLGKAPDGLSDDESLSLAALLPAPNARPAQLRKRLCALVRRHMRNLSCDGPARALARMLARADAPPAWPDLAPHLAARLLAGQRSDVRTTLDAPIQRFVRDALAQQLARLGHRNVRDGAVLVVENATGKVLAWAGANAATSRSPYVDGVRAHRQAGSTLKPQLYALAIEHRLITAASLLKDAPIHLQTAGGLYVPQNYDHGYKGLVSARTALGNSLNIPAVRTLLLTGVEPFRQRLFNAGYLGITLDGDYYGFSLALGSAEVSLAEQVNAYRTLANGGLFTPLRVRSQTPAAPPRRVVGEGAAYIVSAMLADRSARLLTFGISNHLNTPFWSAVKTGTSKAMRDNWCIGFSREFTVGVWVGNFEGEPMHGVSGVSGAAPLWHDVLAFVQGTRPSTAPPPPPGVVKTRVRFSGNIEPPRDEVFLRGTAMKTVTAVPDRVRSARIVRPAAGAILALDPDIPRPYQRLQLAARNTPPGARFALDGRAMALNSLWLPRPGRHSLALQNAKGTVLDQVHFSVRAP